MRYLSGTVGVLTLVLLGAALLPGDRARADDKRPESKRPDGKQPADPSLLVFDIRMVRVETSHPEGIEQPCPLLSGDASTTRASWPEILAALKKRGKTTVLMDARTTTYPGRLTKVSEERQVPVILVQSRIQKAGQPAAENLAAARLRTGCKAELVVSEGALPGAASVALLEYKLETRGTMSATFPGAASSTETLHSWMGAHPALNAETLVLTHRQQVFTPGEDAPRGVEIYGFISVAR